MSDQNTTEGLVLGHQHMHAFAPEDFRKVYGAVTHAILRGDTRMTTIERVRDMVSRVWVPANLAIRNDKDVAGIGVRTLLAWIQELALIVAQMKADEQERERSKGDVQVTNTLQILDRWLHAIEQPENGQLEIHAADVRAVKTEVERLREALRSIFKRFNDVAGTGFPPPDRTQSLVWAMASDAREALGEEWPEGVTPPPASTAPPEPL